MRTDARITATGAWSSQQIGRLSELDTERFGLRIARIDDVTASEVDRVTAGCLDDGVRMVIARCQADDFAAVHALERTGYRLMESSVDYLGPVMPAPGSPFVREARAEDVGAISAVARSAFASYAGHYHADPRLPDAECAEVYVSWARRCADGEAAENVVVAESEGRVVGFQAHRSPSSGTGQLLLVCVAPEGRGRGLYRALGAHAQRWSAKQGHSRLLAVCHQSNFASHKVFMGLGLRPARVTCTFHGWADELRPSGQST